MYTMTILPIGRTAGVLTVGGNHNKMKKGILYMILLILIGGCFSYSIKEGEAKILAEEFIEHPEITEMDDCTRAKKYVNDIRISMDKDTTDEKKRTYLEKTRYYKTVLSEQGIEEQDFNYFKNRLNETGLRHYYKKDNYSVFITGGAMGDIEGILVVQRNDSIPNEGFRLNEHCYIWIGKKIEENVYWISGS